MPYNPAEAQYGNPSLSAAEAAYTCGPIAAAAFARFFGRNPTAREAVDIAHAENLISAATGMYGTDAEVALIKRLGVAVEKSGPDWGRAQAIASQGQPVIISTPGHYFMATAYDPQKGFYVGNTGLAYKRGSEWMSPWQIESLGGSVKNILYAPPGTGPQGANDMDPELVAVITEMQSQGYGAAEIYSALKTDGAYDPQQVQQAISTAFGGGYGPAAGGGPADNGVRYELGSGFAYIERPGGNGMPPSRTYIDANGGVLSTQYAENVSDLPGVTQWAFPNPLNPGQLLDLQKKLSPGTAGRPPSGIQTLDTALAAGSITQQQYDQRLRELALGSSATPAVSQAMRDLEAARAAGNISDDEYRSRARQIALGIEAPAQLTPYQQWQIGNSAQSRQDALQQQAIANDMARKRLDWDIQQFGMTYERQIEQDRLNREWQQIQWETQRPHIEAQTASLYGNLEVNRQQEERQRKQQLLELAKGADPFGYLAMLRGGPASGDTSDKYGVLPQGVGRVFPQLDVGQAPQAPTSAAAAPAATGGGAVTPSAAFAGYGPAAASPGPAPTGAGAGSPVWPGLPSAAPVAPTAPLGDPYDPATEGLVPGPYGAMPPVPLGDPNDPATQGLTPGPYGAMPDGVVSGSSAMQDISGYPADGYQPDPDTYTAQGGDPFATGYGGPSMPGLGTEPAAPAAPSGMGPSIINPSGGGQPQLTGALKMLQEGTPLNRPWTMPKGMIRMPGAQAGGNMSPYERAAHRNLASYQGLQQADYDDWQDRIRKAYGPGASGGGYGGVGVRRG